MAPAPDAQLIYGSEEFPGNAGVLVFDDNAHPSSGQIVYLAFAFSAMSATCAPHSSARRSCSTSWSTTAA